MSRSNEALEIITVGRSSVDLYGEQIGGRLEDMGSFAKYIGGSPTNTAVGAARLGLNAGLLTRVGADHMGRFIREQLVRERVDVRGVITDGARLTALVILGIRDQATFPLVFYRENCADMALAEADIDAHFVGSAGAVLINGTHLSRPAVYAASLAAARCVKAKEGRVVFDVDYRPVLWGLTAPDRGEDRFVENEEVTRRLQEVLPLCDLIVGTEEELHILGGVTETIAALKVIRQKSAALIVCKLGSKGCVAFAGTIAERLDQGLVHDGFPVEVFNVLGAGDAFMAGFLRGWLRDEPVAQCCEWGNACGAIVVSRHGCAPAMPTWVELQQFLTAGPWPFRLRADTRLEHVHWATTRTQAYDELTVLAFDHRRQFEDLARAVGADPQRIAAFKALALRAVDLVAKSDKRFGVLVDGRYGFETLAMAADTPYWLGRPIEVPNSRPLEFESSEDVATELATWPLGQVVKCLVYYHPDDESELRQRQERALVRLFDACRKTRHELLLEIILPQGMEVANDTIARAIRRMYAIGVWPDWWKLMPRDDAENWRQIDAAIRENDPLCRGVLLLGLSAPQEDVIASFAVAAPFLIVKGFAVGRTIFHEVARDWLSNRIDDQSAVESLAHKFRMLVEAWRRLRRAAVAEAVVPTQ